MKALLFSMTLDLPSIGLADVTLHQGGHLCRRISHSRFVEKNKQVFA